jgi:hypothetical protein
MLVSVVNSPVPSSTKQPCFLHYCNNMRVTTTIEALKSREMMRTFMQDLTLLSKTSYNVKIHL